MSPPAMSLDPKDFNKRFQAAKRHRQDHESELREATRYGFNGREAEWDHGRRAGTRSHGEDRDEIFDTTAAEENQDFAADLFSAMTPENKPWVAYERGPVPEDLQDAADELISQRKGEIATAIKSSNYYDEAPTAFQDAGIGVVGLWISRPQFSRPVNCEAVPLSELYLTLGNTGIEDRFRLKRHFARMIPALSPNWAEIEPRLSLKLRAKIKEDKGLCTCIWGFWRDYSDPEAPVWTHHWKIDSEIVWAESFETEAALPLVVGRFNPRPKSAWGWGPLRRMLPRIRVLDTLASMNLEKMDQVLDPAYTYPHDGILDLSEGIEPGVGYPKMPGSEDIVPIGDARPLDYGFFKEEDLRRTIQRGFYRPEDQRGKTPPSASQFMGEEQKSVRRMSRPAGKLWQEFGANLVRRFEYLEAEAGNIEALILSDGSLVTVRPISPLERSQSREDVIQAQGLMGIATEALGEQAPIFIDGAATFRNIKAKLGDELVEFRSNEEAAQFLQQVQGLTQGGGPAGPGGAGARPGAGGQSDGQ